MKLKLYPYSLMDKIQTDPKAYDKDSYKKIGMDELPTTMTLDHDINKYFLHMELCDSSITRWLSMKKSRCQSLVRSDAESANVASASDAQAPSRRPVLNRWESATGDELPDWDQCPLCIGRLVSNYIYYNEGTGNEFHRNIPLYGDGIA